MTGPCHTNWSWKAEKGTAWSPFRSSAGRVVKHLTMPSDPFPALRPSWTCLFPALRPSWTCLFPAQRLLWTCLFPAQHLSWTCLFPAQRLLWTCHVPAQRLLWTCHVPAQRLSWTCLFPAQRSIDLGCSTLQLLKTKVGETEVRWDKS